MHRNKSFISPVLLSFVILFRFPEPGRAESGLFAPNSPDEIRIVSILREIDRGYAARDPETVLRHFHPQFTDAAGITLDVFSRSAKAFMRSYSGIGMKTIVESMSIDGQEAEARVTVRLEAAAPDGSAFKAKEKKILFFRKSGKAWLITGSMEALQPASGSVVGDRYYNADCRCGVARPQGWRMAPVRSRFDFAAALSPADDPSTYASFSGRRLPVRLSAEEILKSDDQMTRELSDKFETLPGGAEVWTAAGMRGAASSVRFTAGGRTSFRKSVYFSRDKDLFLFVLESETPEGFKKRQAAFRGLVESLKLNEPPPPDDRRDPTESLSDQFPSLQ